jgi:hypothetical protein
MSQIQTDLPGGLPFSSQPGLADVWQVRLDPAPGDTAGGLLLGKGTPYGITGFEGLGLPDQRTADVAPPADHGVIALGDYHTARNVTIGIGINAAQSCGSGDDMAAQAWDQLRTVTGWWQARTQNVLLELRMTTGQTYLMVGRPRKCDADTSRLNRGIVTIAAQFTAVDPRLYDAEQRSIQITLRSEDDTATDGLCLLNAAPGSPILCFDVDFGPGTAATYGALEDLDMTYGELEDTGLTYDQLPTLLDLGGGGGGGSGTAGLCLPIVTNGNGIAFNCGNTDSAPRFDLYGDMIDPVIRNETTGRQIGLIGTFAAGVHFPSIDMRQRRVLLGTAERFDLLAPQADFFPLVPGNNELRLRHSGTTAAQMRVSWRCAWL